MFRGDVKFFREPTKFTNFIIFWKPEILKWRELEINIHLTKKLIPISTTTKVVNVLKISLKNKRDLKFGINIEKDYINPVVLSLLSHHFSSFFCNMLMYYIS